MIILSILLNTTYAQVFANTGDNFTFNKGTLGYQRANNLLNKMISESLTQIEVEDDYFSKAASFSDITELGENFSKQFALSFYAVSSALLDSLKGTKTEEAINAIKDKAETITEDLFSEKEVVNEKGVTSNKAEESKDKVLVLVDEKNQKILPNVDKLSNYMNMAQSLKNYKGLGNLIKRLMAMPESSDSSVKSVLDFLERADLPLTNEGNILAYKIVAKHPDENGVYLDYYTYSIPQMIGDEVCIDKSLIDTNRDVECSVGLHIARRGYLNCFSGDVCLLVMVKPENIITVPHGDCNKVRACSYLILDVLTEEQDKIVRDNKSLMDAKNGKNLIAKAIELEYKPNRQVLQYKEDFKYKIKVTNFTDPYIINFYKEVHMDTITVSKRTKVTTVDKLQEEKKKDTKTNTSIMRLKAKQILAENSILSNQNCADLYTILKVQKKGLNTYGATIAQQVQYAAWKKEQRQKK